MKGRGKTTMYVLRTSAPVPMPKISESRSIEHMYLVRTEIFFEGSGYTNPVTTDPHPAPQNPLLIT